MAPAAGGVFAFADVFERSAIFSFETPDSAHSARSMIMGNTLRTAASFRQIGPRIFGFQNSGSSNALSQARSTRQTKAFVPFDTVSKPCAPKTSTSASSEIDAGAA